LDKTYGAAYLAARGWVRVVRQRLTTPP
jgi:hypothetical protein